MAINTFSTSISGLNKEIRISSKHRFNSEKLESLIEGRNFVFLKSILLESPQYGSNQPGAEVEDDEFVRYIRITDVDEFGNLISEDPKTAKKIEEKYRLKNNDFLFARSGNTVGKSFLFNEKVHPESIFAGYFIRFKIDFDFILPKLMLWYTKSRIFDLWKNATMRVMGQPNINAEEYKLLPIPKIKRETQETIVEKIGELEKVILSLKEKQQEPLQVINEFFAEFYNYSSILWKEFGKGMTAGSQKSDTRILKHYKVNFSQVKSSKIGRISSRFHNPITQELTTVLRGKPTIQIRDITTESVQRGKQPKNDPEGVIFAIKTAQLKNGYFDFENCDLVSTNFYESSNRGKVQFGDILISSTGKVSLGKIDIVDFEDEGIVDGHVSIIRIDQEKYNGLFLTYFLRSLLGTFQIERDYTGATNQIELYRDEIESFEIPDISIDEQERLSQRIKNALDKQRDLEKEIKEQQSKINEIIEEAIKVN